MSMSESLVAAAAAAAATASQTSPHLPAVPSRRTGTTINQIFKATYSGVPVYEFICRGVAVMRRRSDSYLNATQILKVADFDKPQRTRILEREVQKGEHEKVQGGYGKYQGTWVPFARGVQIARQYNIEQELRPVFDFTPTAESPPLAPKHITAATNRPKKAREAGEMRLLPKVKRKIQMKRILPKVGQSNIPVAAKAPYSTTHHSSPAGSPAGAGGDSDHSFLSDSDISSVGSEVSADGFQDSDVSESEMSEHSSPDRSRKRRKSNSPDSGRNAEYSHYADAFLRYFLSDSQDAPKILMNLPSDFDVNLVIDEEGHSPLHWAAAMARIKVLQILMQEGANMGCINHEGQTPLIRSVMFSNNYDNRTFAELLELLHPTFFAQDRNGQTVLHHIVLMESQGKCQAARFYMECAVDRILRNNKELGPVVDVVDINGETALTIAARIANKRLVKLLLKVGGDPKIKNKLGISADEYAMQAYEKCTGVGAGREDMSEGGNSVLSETKTNPFNGRPPSLQTAAAAGARASSKVLPVLHKYVDMVGSKFEKETVETEMEIVELNRLLESIKREAEEARRTVEALRVETDQLPKIQDRIQSLQGELRQTINRNQRLKLRALVHQFSSEFDPDPSFSENAAAITCREQFRKEAQALHENLLALQTDRKRLVEEIVVLRSQPGNRHAEYRKLISTCCNVPVENVDSILDPLLESMDAKSVRSEKISARRDATTP